MTTEIEIALRDRGASAVSGRREASRLIAQWFKDPEGKLAMRWVRRVELAEPSLPDALAA
jgi:hypothetical protein